MHIRPFLLLASLACSGRSAPLPAPNDAPEAAAPEAHATAPEAQAAEAEAPEHESLTLDPRYLAWDDRSGIASFTPGSDVRRASYTHYQFDAAALEAALGGRPDAPVDIEVEVLSTDVGQQTPEDPMAAAPEGGFTITTKRVRVLPQEAQ